MFSSALRSCSRAVDAASDAVFGRLEFSTNSPAKSLDSGAAGGDNTRPNARHIVTAERQANAVRRGLITKAHPEVAALAGKDPLTGVAVLAVVALQCAVAAALARADFSWTAVILIAACVVLRVTVPLVRVRARARALSQPPLPRLPFPPA